MSMAFLTPHQRPVDRAEIRAEVQRNVEEALRQSQSAVARAAAAQAQAQGGATGEGAATTPEPGRTFRVEAGGRVVEVDGEQIAVTTATQPPPPFVFEPAIPPQAVVIAIAFFAMIAFIIVGLPIARAISRRMDRSPPAGNRAISEQAEQLRRIETAVDAMAVEIERISEGQRFVTKLLADRELAAVDAAGDARIGAGARPAERD